MESHHIGINTYNGNWTNWIQPATSSLIYNRINCQTDNLKGNPTYNYQQQQCDQGSDVEQHGDIKDRTETLKSRSSKKDSLFDSVKQEYVPSVIIYDHTTVCCLPPPSPAPSSDRLVCSDVGNNQHCSDHLQSCLRGHTIPHLQDDSKPISSPNECIMPQIRSDCSALHSSPSVYVSETKYGAYKTRNDSLHINASAIIKKHIAQQGTQMSCNHEARILTSESQLPQQSSCKGLKNRFNDSYMSNAQAMITTTACSLSHGSKLMRSDIYLMGNPPSVVPLSDNRYTGVKSAGGGHLPLKDYIADAAPAADMNSNLQKTCTNLISVNAIPPPMVPTPSLLTSAHNNCTTLPYRYIKCCSNHHRSPPSEADLAIRTWYDNIQRHAHVPPICTYHYYPNETSGNDPMVSIDVRKISRNDKCSQHSHGFTNCHGDAEYLNKTLSASGGRQLTKSVIKSDAYSSIASSGYNNYDSYERKTHRGDSNSGTCAYCNAVRRTTGVHQMTQTTGPTSPLPQSQTPYLIKHKHCHSMLTRDNYMCSITSSPKEEINLNSVITHPSTIHYGGEQEYAELEKSSAIYELTQKSNMSNTAELRFNNIQTRSELSTQQNMQSRFSDAFNQTQERNEKPLDVRQQQSYVVKGRVKDVIKQKLSRYFCVDPSLEDEDFILWQERHRRFALRRFAETNFRRPLSNSCRTNNGYDFHNQPDILSLAKNNLRNGKPELDMSTNKLLLLGSERAPFTSIILVSITHIFNLLRRQRPISITWKLANQRNCEAEQIGSDITSPNTKINEQYLSALIDDLLFDNGGKIEKAYEQVEETTLINGTTKWLAAPRNANPTLSNAESQVLHSSRKLAPNKDIHSWSPPNRQSPIPLPGEQGHNSSLQIFAHQKQRLIHLPSYNISNISNCIDYRPYFTYWINTVQIIVLGLSLFSYGIGPIGISIEKKTGQVLVTTLSLQTVQHEEQQNPWVGPRRENLIHMGAKFPTCMRHDIRTKEVYARIQKQERDSACCIRNDDTGCVQSSQADCTIRSIYHQKSVSTWKKWTAEDLASGGRMSGSVCGLDPKFCELPASVAPYEWPDDITKWPICRKPNSFAQRSRFKDHTAEHMVCEVIGHPCCTGVFGECQITTREYCDFLGGYFHEDASLCSQVPCLNNACGMLPFITFDYPDQIYRLLTSLCIHAGVVHLLTTVIFQHIFLGDLERLIGSVRAAALYIFSGMIGNLISSLVVPYNLEVGPTAALSGVLAATLVLLLFVHRNHIRKYLIFKLFMVVFFYIAGSFFFRWQPHITALLTGLFCGAFLTVAFVPFVSISTYTRHAKVKLIWTCVSFHAFMASSLLVLFYVFPSNNLQGIFSIDKYAQNIALTMVYNNSKGLRSSRYELQHITH